MFTPPPPSGSSNYQLGSATTTGVFVISAAGDSTAVSLP
jgi:hypothetical protein